MTTSRGVVVLAATLVALLSACGGGGDAKELAPTAPTVRPVATDPLSAIVATTNGYDPAGRSSKALDALIVRLNAFHTTGR